MLFKAKVVRIRESITLMEVMEEISLDTAVQKRTEKELRCKDFGHQNLTVSFVYLLFLRRIFKNTGFEEWVLFIRVIIHPFTEVISNIKSSEREKTKYLNICKLAVWGFF